MTGDVQASSAAESFKPLAVLYRRKLQRFLRISMIGFLLIFAAVILQGSFAQGLGIAGVAGICLSLLSYLSLPNLKCPSCAKAPDSGIAGYCPVCGGTELQGIHCKTCKKSMGAYRFRNYVIRFCTHCGVLLDKRGV